MPKAILWYCTECNHVFYGDLRECTNCHKTNLSPLTINNVITSELSVNVAGCPDCGSPYAGGKYEAHFLGCPRDKKLQAGAGK